MGQESSACKARRTRVINAARAIAARISALSECSDDMTLEALKRQRCSKGILCEAFWLLDNEPRRFAEHQVWHPRLRSLRNNPIVGEAMFDQFH